MNHPDRQITPKDDPMKEPVPIDEARSFESWDPNSDADERWLAIRAVLRESDEAPMPPAADFDGMRAALRAELENQRLLKPAGTRSRPFGEWLRGLLLGGGPGAQLFRFAAVAGVATFVGMNVKDEHSPAPGWGQEAHLAQVPARDVASDPSGEALPELAAKEANAFLAEPAAAPATMANLSEAAPAPAPRAMVSPAEMAGAGMPMRKMDSGEAVRFRVKDAEVQPLHRRDTAAPTSANAFGLVSAAADSAVEATPASSDRGGLLGGALERLQVMKFNALVADDQRALSDIRFVEQLVTAAHQNTAMNDGGGGRPQDEIVALEKYRRGEESLATRRYEDAVDAFAQARALAPTSFLGFLSQFQIARIQYDDLEDYDSALTSYRVCLEEYPAQYLSDEYREHILERVQLLTRTAYNDWRDLRYWNRALRGPTPADTAAQLAALLTREPQSLMAAAAAERLMILTISDSATQTISLDDTVKALEHAVAYRGPGPDTARIQFALAEVLFRRAMNLNRALAEYREVLDMKPDSELGILVYQRAEMLANQRLTLGNAAATPIAEEPAESTP